MHLAFLPRHRKLHVSNQLRARVPSCVVLLGGRHDRGLPALAAVFAVGGAIVIVAVTPGVGICIIPLLVIYVFVHKRFIATTRELKRLDSVAISPIIGHYSETVQVESPQCALLVLP
jgi:hypothetical protein